MHKHYRYESCNVNHTSSERPVNYNRNHTFCPLLELGCLTFLLLPSIFGIASILDTFQRPFDSLKSDRVECNKSLVSFLMESAKFSKSSGAGLSHL